MSQALTHVLRIRSVESRESWVKLPAVAGSRLRHGKTSPKPNSGPGPASRFVSAFDDNSRLRPV
jgi:hypothetical protein